MHTSPIDAPRAAASPRTLARVAGLFYLLMAVFGEAANAARGGLIVNGNAAATATNILAHQALYVAGYAGDMLMVTAYVIVVALFYRLFRPVHRSVALTAAAVGLTGCAVLTIAYTYELVPLTLLGTGRVLDAVPIEQRQALAYAFLRFYSATYGASLVFFGLYLGLTGWLIVRSTFMPRVLGLLLMLGVWGLAFLSPPFAVRYLAWLRLGSLGELTLLVWLLVKGVNAECWDRQASDTRLS